ncbi:hypothetical protein MAR_022330 [Mya arenaria]|uniref:Uncharacterized protein n=1 Tax=Mya arenaria TaxID=6604 RepID=A0ABY7DJW1_MYAAR|nr:hypothetical protein MAR_022330 [Mya arenaria]
MEIPQEKDCNGNSNTNNKQVYTDSDDDDITITSNTNSSSSTTTAITISTHTRLLVREIGRKLRHAPGLLVTDEDWKSCSDALKDLLQDPKYMKGDNHTKDAVDQLNKLEQDTLKVSDEEVLKVLQDSAETLKRLIEDSNIIKEKVEDLKSLEHYIENT